MQVQDNLESQRRPYALADLARDYGFRDVVTIDDDLGRSASGLTTPAIAARLNREGHRTGHGFEWTECRVAAYRRTARIPVYAPPAMTAPGSRCGMLPQPSAYRTR